MPKAYISVVQFWFLTSPNTSSGDAYSAFPMKIPVAVISLSFVPKEFNFLAIPKSINFMQPSVVTIIFPGSISLCIYPLSCKAKTPDNIFLIIYKEVASLSFTYLLYKSRANSPLPFLFHQIFLQVNQTILYR